MSEKQRVEELLRRLDESLIILRDVLNDLQEISKSMRSEAPLPSPSMQTPSISTPQPSPQPPSRKRGIDDVKVMFPKDLEGLLTFTEKGDYVIIKPRQYLGSENFAKIASVIRGAGGEYISAGKESHFRIPK